MEGKASWPAAHRQAAPSLGDGAGTARIVSCPAGKLSAHTYVAFQCARVETSSKASIEFLVKDQMRVLKLMLSTLVWE